jgi:hypothetical protein
MQAAAGRLRVCDAKSALRAANRGRLRVESRRLRLPRSFHAWRHWIDVPHAECGGPRKGPRYPNVGRDTHVASPSRAIRLVGVALRRPPVRGEPEPRRWFDGTIKARGTITRALTSPSRRAMFRGESCRSESPAPSTRARRCPSIVASTCAQILPNAERSTPCHQPKLPAKTSADSQLTGH